jgi:hypothetical protein
MITAQLPRHPCPSAEAERRLRKGSPFALFLFGIQGAGVVAGASGVAVGVSGAAAGADEGASVFAGSDAFSSLFWSEQPAAIVATVESTSKVDIFVDRAIRISLSFSRRARCRGSFVRRGGVTFLTLGSFAPTVAWRQSGRRQGRFGSNVRSLRRRG